MLFGDSIKCIDSADEPLIKTLNRLRSTRDKFEQLSCAREIESLPDRGFHAGEFDVPIELHRMCQASQKNGNSCYVESDHARTVKYQPRSMHTQIRLHFKKKRFRVRRAHFFRNFPHHYRVAIRHIRLHL